MLESIVLRNGEEAGDITLDAIAEALLLYQNSRIVVGHGFAGRRSGRCRKFLSTASAQVDWPGCRQHWRKSPRRLRLNGQNYRYCAAVMNSLKVSHHTITVLNFVRSTPCGTGTMKLLNVFTSPTRSIWGLRRLNSASVSTNSGDR